MAKKFNVDILRLQILLQDVEEAESAHRQGSSELALVLKEFRERLDQNQLNQFNNYFFGNSNNKTNESTNLSDNTDITLKSDFKINYPFSKEKKNQDKKTDWIKKLYKKIVQRTHPDKFIDFPIKEIKDKYTKVYMTAVTAFNENDPGVLLLCAYESEISFEHIEEAESFIKSSQDSLKSKIAHLNTLLGYQWFHLDEEKRLVMLESYLKSLGFKFNREKAKEVIRNINKRKPGQRPEKLSKLRVKRKQLK